MKREIKFRAWCEINEKWIYFTIGQQWSEVMRSVYFRIVLNGGKFYQFIGIRDSGGKDIYEDDILMNQMQWIGVVVYDPEKCYYNISDDYPDTMYNGDMINVAGYNWMKGEIEVIGNIHENKDLLTP